MRGWQRGQEMMTTLQKYRLQLSILHRELYATILDDETLTQEEFDALWEIDFQIMVFMERTKKSED